MKEGKKRNIYAMTAITFLFLMTATSGYSIVVSISNSSGGTWEDVVLITSVSGNHPLDAMGVGDVSLTNGIYTFGDLTVDSATQDWWLIGHIGEHVAYTSGRDLSSTDLYDIAPYDLYGAELAWNIPVNLDAYVNEGVFDLNWWIRTINYTGVHVVADGETATLWEFTTGTNIATVGVDFDGNGTPPPPPVVPEPMTLALIGLGLGGLATVRRRS